MIKIENNYVFDECKDWLIKYQEEYDILNCVRSSQEGRKYALNLNSSVKIVSDLDNKERYVFALNLQSSMRDFLVEGSHLSVSSENKAVINYLLAALTTHYLTSNSDISSSTSIKKFVNSQESLNNFQFVCTDDYSETLTSYTLSDIMKRSEFSTIILDAVKSHLLGLSEEYVQKYYDMADLEKKQQDSAFIYSVDYSDRCFQQVLCFRSINRS